jgi:uncharacterized protein YecE (DUF72 family)
MQQRVGTIGFGYPQWSGAFYPPGTQSGDFLAYYARCFDCVELDTTYYGIPDPRRIARWADIVPDHFRFAVKTPRDITHIPRVSDAAPLMAELLRSLEPMGEKLEYLLLQFPATYPASSWRDLDALIRTIPTNVPLAAEFRHASWRTPEIERFLRDHAITWASADLIGQPRELRLTSDTAYLRLIGVHDRFPNLNREEIDVTEDLTWWKTQLAAAQPRKAWILFNNDYAGHSPATADRWRKMHALPTPRPPSVEMGLFG